MTEPAEKKRSLRSVVITNVPRVQLRVQRIAVEEEVQRSWESWDISQHWLRMPLTNYSHTQRARAQPAFRPSAPSVIEWHKY